MVPEQSPYNLKSHQMLLVELWVWCCCRQPGQLQHPIACTVKLATDISWVEDRDRLRKCMHGPFVPAFMLCPDSLVADES